MTVTPGTRLGSYEILGALGAGGMGEVYRARDVRLGRVVALKILPAEFAQDTDRLARFENEARLASSLNHPNIITIYEIGQESSTRFIVMEYVEGRTLRDVMGAAPMPLRDVLHIAAQAADGLAKAHAAGIVHRDLKPANLMVTLDGFIKILDFGLSKLEASSFVTSSEQTTRLEGRTRVGTVVGTAEYMSPEQAKGRPIDFRSDQFSLGLVLYEMGTGKHAFRRDTAVQTLAAIIQDEPPPISAWNPKLPAALCWIVERCLAKDPEARYASTRDLARDLADLRDHVGGSGALWAPAPRTWRRRFIAAAAAVLVALVLMWRFAVPFSRQQVSGHQIPAVKHIAVLAFTNVGVDRSDQYLCDGLTETVTSKLTQLEQFEGALRVVPSSELRSRNVLSADEARRAFGVNLVITGSFQRAGDRVRINVNLVDAKSLLQLRSMPIDTRIDDVSVMQDGVVARVAELIELELQPQEQRALTAGGTSVPDAYVFYLQGRGYLQRFDKPENVDSAVELFQQALSRDNRYALAHAGLGEAYWRKYELTKDRQWIDRARESCARAIELNDGLAPVHVALGVIENGTGEYERAIRQFERALRIDPATADAYRELANAYMALGKVQDAESTYKEAIRARPNDWASYTRLGAFYIRQARYSDAEAAFRTVTELTPDNYIAFSSLGATYVQMARYNDAVAMLEKSVSMQPSYPAASNLGTAYFYQGRYAQSAAAFERALSLDDRDYRVWRNLAAAYRFVPNQQAKALAAYERAATLAQTALRVNPRQPEVLMHLADCYSMLDQPDRARDYVRQALALASGDVSLLFTAGNVYEQLGDRDLALDAIGRAIRQGYSVDQVQRSPYLARLRSDPRFSKLLEGVKSR